MGEETTSPSNSRPTLEMLPSDIITGLATLIGLLFTALGLLANAHLDTNFFAILADTIIIIMLLFIATASLAALGSATRRTAFWTTAKAIYPVSWIIFGLGMFAILLAFVYGPTIFQISLPNFSGSILIPIMGTIGFIAATISGIYNIREFLRENDTGSVIRCEDIERQVAAERLARGHKLVSFVSWRFLFPPWW